MMQRQALDQLIDWKNNDIRKPLVLNGARQVGKTYLLQYFGQQHFRKVHYINFESSDTLAELFAQDLDVQRIITELGFHLHSAIDLDNDLLIFDEIQACPRALTSLKYFAENLPHLAVCAAGSLLGLQLNSASFPVGKVDMLQLYPLTFAEFLAGTGQQQLSELYNSITLESEIPVIAHQQLWQQLKLYFVIGGLPEVVQNYADSQEDLYTALEAARAKQDAIIRGYLADIAKHAGKVNAMHVERVWANVPMQLANAQSGHSQRFRFKDLIPGIDRYSRLANVFDWLNKAQLIIKTNIVNHAEQPLAAHSKESLFRCYFFDTGLLGAMTNLAPKVILDYDYGNYKGYFAENFVAQALQTQSGKPLYCWQHNRSEVEFIREYSGHIIPIEVKAGNITRAKSLQQFVEQYQPPYRVIMSARNLQLDHKYQVRHIPLYLAGRGLDQPT